LAEIKNPNLQGQGPGGGSGGGGGDMRSTMGFMLLLLVVLLGYQYFFKPKAETNPAPAQTQTQTQTAAQGQAGAGQPGQSEASAAAGQSAASTPAVTAALETDTTVENEQFRIVFSNRGAQVKQWILKKYNDTAGKPLDMVQQQAAGLYGFPLSLFTYEPALTSQVNQALYQVTVAGAQPSATGVVLAPASLTFHYAANGLDVVKTLSFDASYVVTFEEHVLRNGAPVRALVEWPAGLGDMEEFLPSSSTRSSVLTPSYFAWSLDGKPTGQSLEPLIQFGWLTVIAKPLYLALRYLFEHGVPNWGWDIIIITVIFNLLMLPTRLMMMKSSLKMMRIQPKVDAIKRKYANLKVSDPKRSEMNTEMMALYKTENVNMYGSCLPLLIQMPLFFAYYRVLANVIELRQAQWYWLHDLSVPDPHYILPGIILVSMFLVQFITPSPGMDPNQRRMMAIMMPVIFGFSMSHFASGLALYWCTGNLINLAIQLGINKSKMGQEMHEIALKRAARKGGGGAGPKTIQGKR